MKNRTIIYKVVDPKSYGGELICDIYSDGSYEISSFKGPEEDLLLKKEVFKHSLSFYQGIAQNGHCTPNYTPYRKEEYDAFQTLCGLFEAPVKSPIETKFSSKKYYHGFTDKDAPLDQFLYIVEYFGDGEPWRDPYEGREDQRPTP